MLKNSWKERLQQEFDKDYMRRLNSFLQTEQSTGKQILPEFDHIFNALDQTLFEQVKVVILGQDPYHGPGQAHGLCFSVPPGIAFPPSLENIFKELQADLGVKKPSSGDLTPWARQGVLLLNSVLTVEAGKANSHRGRGWESFTDAVIKLLASEKRSLVFILWGAYAQKKGQFIDRTLHHVIESVHPSPLSSYRGFLGSKPFSKTNDFLRRAGQKPIDWSLSG